jgi:hypothetical protein
MLILMTHLDDVQAAYDAWQDARRALVLFIPEPRSGKDAAELNRLREAEGKAWEALTLVRGF